MTADKPSPVIPKLRFAQFVDEPPWECPPLKKLAKRITRRNTHGGADLRALTNSAEHGVIDQREYFDKDIATNTSSYYIVEPGDYVYNPRRSSGAPVGPISKNQIRAGVMSPIYTVFRFRSDANDFFAHYFRSAHWHGYLRRVSNSGARHDRMAITNDDLMQMPIPTPSSGEQQKIADCLGSLDDLIAADGRRLDVLRQQKQGLMQQIFPQTGETRPRVRFPEFRDAVEWQRCTLGEIAKMSKGKGISKSDVVVRGRTPCVRYGELYTSYGEIIETVKSSTNLPASDLVLSNAGDVIIPASGETKEDIATCACVVDGGVALGSDLNVIRSPVDGRFFSYYLNGSRRRELAKVAQGDAVAHLYPAQLSGLEVYIPKAKAEQQRIADCLSSLDARLAAQVQRIDVLKMHRQGLLQQVFPSLEDH